MTPAQRASAFSRGGRGPGFTLVELIAVIGIIAVLAGVLIPTISMSRKRAAMARTRADLEAIASALNAYQQDWGMYPPVGARETRLYSGWDVQWQNGSMVLFDALFDSLPVPPHLGDTVVSMDMNLNTWRRKRAGSVRYGAYLDASKFNIFGNMINDRGSDPAPIAYFPAHQTTSSVSLTRVGPTGLPTYVGQWVYPSTPGLANPPMIYNFADAYTRYTSGGTPAVRNIPWTAGNPRGLHVADMQMILTDSMTLTSPAGCVPAGGRPIYTGPYILWAVGPSGHYGFGLYRDTSTGNLVTGSSPKTDAITNFEIPPQFRK